MRPFRLKTAARGKTFFLKHRGLLIPLFLALLVEATVCQLSFWSTLFQKWTDISGEMEFVSGYVTIEDMETAAAQGNIPADEQGYLHEQDGALLLRWKNMGRKVDRIHLDLDIPEGCLVKAAVFMQDEGNRYIYQLGTGRVLLAGVEENGWMKVYPYGETDNLYLRLETADRYGNAAAGSMGELTVKINGVEINGRMPFALRPARLLFLFALFFLLYGLSERNRFAGVLFEAGKENRSGRRKRRATVWLFTAGLIALAFFFVRMNPSCQKNLAVHHAQYQELAVAISQGRVSVGEADPALLEVENPYDTICLQANGIPYQADYAYYDGNYYVYFGIVPELLLYLPYYLLTGKNLPNYLAVFFFFAGFIAASAGLVYELMKRFFPRLPFYLYGVAVFMLVGSYSYFYLLIRPDLYHVPIAASCMFTAAGLWCYLAGLNRERGKTMLYAAGSLCLALTAGCRPQFVLFALLALPLFWEEVFEKRNLFSRKGAIQTAALALPYAAVAAGLMYYNAIRFGAPFDFGAAYSLTSNDMTHRGFNLERILYGMWYFLLEPARLEAAFPYLKSVSIETDYLGRMVSESSFGGIFACSMLAWPALLLILLRTKKRAECRTVFWTGIASAFVAVVICAADATGAGILQRYSSDISLGLFLAAVIGLFLVAERAMEKKITGAFLTWLKVALILHGVFLFLVLIQTDGSINLLTGDPVMYYKICAMLRF
ncbi:MAG: hypothetical protein Q4C58_12710 [Eubacteriales bacterium]|nr:hypothetical protein [Eubacteriales bacterium]